MPIIEYAYLSSVLFWHGTCYTDRYKENGMSIILQWLFIFCFVIFFGGWFVVDYIARVQDERARKKELMRMRWKTGFNGWFIVRNSGWLWYPRRKCFIYKTRWEWKREDGLIWFLSWKTWHKPLRDGTRRKTI
jgi:hypothetical protein